jgi:hypothetical protein
MGEGWGGGAFIFEPVSQMNATLPLTPSHQGRGNLADYPLLIAGVGAKRIIGKIYYRVKALGLWQLSDSIRKGKKVLRKGA